MNWNDINNGKIIEVSEEEYDYYLGVLPPKFYGRQVKLMNGQTIIASFGFVEGADRITAFWQDEGKYYAAGTTLFNGYVD